MIICICRNIKDSDYDSKEELIKRIQQQDVCCGRCQEYYNKLVDTVVIVV